MLNKFIIKTDGTILHRKNNKPLKFYLNKKGYLISSSLKSMSCLIHRVIAETFIPNPENKPQVNHINGIKTDNRVENLEWVTNQENRDHAKKLGLIARGVTQGHSKLTEQDIINIRKDFRLNKIIAKQYNVDPSTISRIKNRLYWSHV